MKWIANLACALLIQLEAIANCILETQHVNKIELFLQVALDRVA